MKVLALTEAPNHVCYRYRIEAFAPYLAVRGWTLESLPLHPFTFQRNSQLRQAATADVVILQRRLLPLWQIRILRKFARFLIYDVDDAVFCRDSYSRKKSASWGRLAHFWATIYSADAITAGNGYLKEQASAYIGPERVHLMPTCVDPSLYPLARHTRRGGDVRLVWIGQHSTLGCLKHAQPALAAAAHEVRGIELSVICNRFPDDLGIRVAPRQWSMATEAVEVASADVGISWLPDDAWSLGKCGLKVLQYMAAGLPVVANPVGMNREMVDHGRTGFLASTPREWARAISTLAENPDLRRTMGAAARARAEGEYSVGRWGDVFASIVDRLPQRTAAAWVSRDRGTAAEPGTRRLTEPAT
jgi:hypothetical protein